MKKAQTIDRATLLKGSGTAALATLLAAALEGRADACCSPIDLTYTDDPAASTAGTSQPRKPHAQAITALRLWAPHPGKSPPGAPWELLFTIPNAHVNGTDENGNPHGANGKPKALDYTISVYVTY